MIKVRVDEAAAFDMLSILQIKANKSEKSSDQFQEALNDLILEIGLNKVNQVLNSELYKDLVNANMIVFKYIDILNSNKDLSAIIVHLANTERYNIKRSIQEKFFNTNLAEEKL